MNKTLFFAFTYEFLERYMPLQVCRSRKTIESYRDALSLFRRFIVDTKGKSVSSFTFGDCTKDVVLDFIEDLQEKGNKISTINQRLAALRAYLWFAADKDIAIQSVALAISHIPKIKTDTSVREELKPEALEALLSQPNPARKIGARDQAIMVLLYDSAIRLSELLALTVGDVHLEGNEPYIFVKGKGRKERIVAITDATANHLHAHIKAYHGINPNIEDPLFFTTLHGQNHFMSASNVERLIQKYADEARKNCSSIPNHVYPHMFRRTRATNLYQDGVPLELVSRILGHSSTETSKIYAKPSMEMMRSAMQSGVQPISNEEPIWVENEDELARLCGLR